MPHNPASLWECGGFLPLRHNVAVIGQLQTLPLLAPVISDLCGLAVQTGEVLSAFDVDVVAQDVSMRAVLVVLFGETVPRDDFVIQREVLALGMLLGVCGCAAELACGTRLTGEIGFILELVARAAGLRAEIHYRQHRSGVIGVLML
jgi:hypothetical protein